MGDMDFDELYENMNIISKDEDTSGIKQEEHNQDNGKTENDSSQNAEITSNFHRYKCGDCGESFLEKSKLTRHKLLRLGTKFVCNTCSSKFSRKDKLYNHLRNHYADMDFSDSFKDMYTISNYGCDPSEVKQELHEENERADSKSID